MNCTLIRCAAGILAVAAAFAQEKSAADQDWQSFRQAYPYHVQAVALSGERPDHSRTLIVSEPPPHATLAGLRELSPAVFASPAIRNTKVGYDGWVKDLVVTLHDSGDRETRALVDRLNIYLFGSAYKSYALSIPPAGAALPARRELNLKVTAGDLDRWLFRSKERFVSHNGGPASPMATLLGSGKSGLYYSEEPGVVALIAPKSPFGVMRRQLREFCLDSDLILGATSYRNHVAIFARERSVPVDLLPPLRTETILQLAAAAPKLSELSQSYERTNFFAGHMDQAGWDWAPVYLSDVLIDTEYGSLLNITDQILKSWSSNGDVEYYKFPYPKPSRWPFDAPIILDAKVDEVTFNWNTKGAGYAVDFPDASGFRRIFSLNRTGALPVNYIPAQIGSGKENPLARYELTGYDYFAGMSDPNLARVVQYASLYQIFHEFGVADDSAPAGKTSHPEWEYLGGIGGKILSLLVSPEIEKLLGPLQRKATEELRQLKKDLDEAKSVFGDGIVSDVGLRLANPRIDEPLRRALASGERTSASLTRLEVRALAAARLARDVQESETGQEIQSDVGRSDKIYRNYAEATLPRSTGWIRTASVVVSRTTGAMAKRYYGGHNLDSRIVTYRASAELKPGEARLVQEGKGQVVLVSPGDIDRIPGVLRTAALTGRTQDLPVVLSRELPRVAVLPPRPRAIALQLEPRQFGAERGLAAANPNSRLALLGGWREAPRADAATAQLNPAAQFSRLGTRAIAIERLPDFSFQVHLAGSDTPRVAMSYDAALDTVIDAMKNVDGPAGSWNLQLQGFHGTEARNFLRSAEVQFTAKENLQLAGFAPESRVPPAEMLRTLRERYDFRRATIQKAAVETEAELGGAAKEALRFEVEIPAIQLTRPSLFMRIRIFFTTRISEPLMATVESAINRILGSRTSMQGVREGTAPTGEQILLDLKRDLRRMRIPGAENVDFQIDVTTEAGDFGVAEIRISRSAWPV